MAETWGNEEEFKPGHRNRIIDDRGRSRVMLEVSDLPGDAASDLRAAVRDANRHRFAHIGVIIIAVLAAAVALQLLISWSTGTGYRMGLLNFAHPGVLFNLLTLGAGWFGIERVRSRARRALTACFQSEICPSCAYNLAGLTAAADGCTICPECGAAWRLKAGASSSGHGG